MRGQLGALAAWSVMAACAAPASPAGRWEGEARIPGAPLPIVLDLSPSAAGGWTGSVTLPGRGVKGAALEDLRVGADGAVQAGLANALGGPPSELPTQLALRMLPDGRLEGDFRQGGHSATASLRRSGEAQVDSPPPRAPLPPALAGTWRGRYELGGVPREVTLTLSPPPAGADPATAPAGELLIVGKRRSQLVVDRVAASERFVTLEASAAGLRLEGRWDGAAGTFDGLVLQGPFEAAVKLQRVGPAAAGASASGRGT
ncbi:hypothetical protein ACS5PM_08820 [Ideonella sp. YS5]